MKKSQVQIANTIVGSLITEERYRYANPRLVSDVVRETIERMIVICRLPVCPNCESQDVSWECPDCGAQDGQGYNWKEAK